MPAFTVTVDERHALAHLDAIGPDVREALRRALPGLAASIRADAVSRAEAHIHTLGLKPGEYLAGFADGTYEKGDRIGGYVRNPSPLAHLLEFGAHPPAHEILPKVAEVLAFQGDAGTVFARAVNSPGATIPPYPALGPAWDAAKDTVAATITEAVRKAAAAAGGA